MSSERIIALEDQIKYHDGLYWDKNDPQISDPEYDMLVEELRRLNPNSPVLNKVHSPSLNRRKYKHPKPMLSLSKAYSPQEVLDWAVKIARNDNEQFSLEPKLDGWSGRFHERILATRGDGEVGDNISDKIPLINVISSIYNGPLQECPNNMIGEIIFTKSSFQMNFKKIVRKDGRHYKTERSALAGLLSPKDTDLSLGKLLTFVSYDLFKSIKTLGELRTFDWSEFVKQVQSWDYPTDGLVIKLVDEEYSHSLGYTSHHPRGQIAMKYGNPSGETKLVGVEWAVGKNNTINPIAQLDPVIIAGHEITRANLHNAKRIMDLGLHIGDSVIIERCGEIIPDVVKVIPGNERKPIVVNQCPVCESKLVYNEPFLYCSNVDCGGSLMQRLAYSLDVLGVKNIGKSTVDKMIDIGCEDLYDILQLTERDMLQLDGFAETSARNAYNELQLVLNNPIEDFKVLASINIKGIGKSMSKKLLKKAPLDQLRKLSPEDLSSFPNIGEIRAWEIYDDLKAKSELLDKLLGLFNVIESFGQTAETRGKVCFTGKMPQKRTYYADIAEKAGFEVSNSVTSSLDYLVCQDPSSTKGKMQKARNLGVKVIHLNDFLNMV